MKLLFDQNLSKSLKDRFPRSRHVTDPDVGLKDAEDGEIWEYAKKHTMTIATTDKGFSKRSGESEHPPKVVLLPGGCKKEGIEFILCRSRDDLIKSEEVVIDLSRWWTVCSIVGR